MIARPERLTVLDLFAGAGGMSLGFHAAGYRILAAVERDESAGRTFEKNFGTLQSDSPPLVLSGDRGDLERISPADMIPDNSRPDVLIGGPPCQGFSRIGRGKLNSLSEEGFEGDSRNVLYRRFLGAIEHWRPRAVVMENVPGMLSVRGVNVADLICDEISALGYRTGYAILNSVWYGVPQFRERLFFIAFRENLGLEPVAPPVTHTCTLPAGYRRPRSGPKYIQTRLPWTRDYKLDVHVGENPLSAVTVSKALDDLPHLLDHLSGESSPREADFRKPLSYHGGAHSDYARQMRGWPGLPPVETVVDHVIRKTPRDYETFRRMRHGDRYPRAYAIAESRFQEKLSCLGERAPEPETAEYSDLRVKYVPPYPVDSFVDKWRKFVPDEPSWTVVAHLSRDCYSHIHHDCDQARAVSIREAARLQSFPDSYAFEGNMGDCFRQIGNAVPPLLAAALGKLVKKVLEPASET